MNLHECEMLFTNALHPSASDEVFLKACNLLVQQGGMAVEDRLLVYRHNVSGGYISALASTYVVCEKILGKACFAAFARDYAWNRIKQSNDLNKLGEDFPLYLEQQIQQREGFEDYTYLADMARFEWWVERSIQADDSDLSNTLDEQSLQKVSAECVYPIVNSSLYLMESDYPVLALWKKHQENSDGSSVEGLDETAYLCICRDENDDVIMQSISKEDYKLLHCCQNDSLHGLASQAEQELIGFLETATQQGWLVGFRR